MSDSHEKPAEALAALNARTDEQRKTLLRLIGVTKERVRPANLAQEVGNHILDAGLNTMDKATALARANPRKTAGIAAVAGIFLMRKPLCRLMRKYMPALRDASGKE